jgi:hypothetical protein
MSPIPVRYAQFVDYADASQKFPRETAPVRHHFFLNGFGVRKIPERARLDFV